jgi:apolipoprotein N-acyltransferase
MEARREIAVATTNSVSGYIDRDGNIIRRTSEFTADSFVETMPLRSAITPALRIAPWLDRGLALAGLVFCLIALTRAPVRPSRGGAPRTDSGRLDPGTKRPTAPAGDSPASLPSGEERRTQ